VKYWGEKKIKHMKKSKINLKKLSQNDFKDNNYSKKNFESCDLNGLDLRKKAFIGTSFKNSNLSNVRFQSANLDKAILEGCDLTNIKVKDTIFNNVKWGNIQKNIKIDIINASQLKNFYAEKGVLNTSDEFYIKQMSEIRKFKWVTEGLKNIYIQPLYFIWWLFSRYGISIKRWIFFCILFITIFSCIYSFKPDMFYSKNDIDVFTIQKNKILWKDYFTPFYFSVVTYSTLGFGDITPTNKTGRVFVTIEVLIGYIMLGGLIAIFTKKLIRN